jgi:hypothetical protein
MCFVSNMLKMSLICIIAGIMLFYCNRHIVTEVSVKKILCTTDNNYFKCLVNKYYTLI